MGKLKGQFVRSKHCSARMKTHIQPSLLTDLHLGRMVSRPANCSWGAACELKFLSYPVFSNLMCKIPTAKSAAERGRIQVKTTDLSLQTTPSPCPPFTSHWRASLGARPGPGRSDLGSHKTTKVLLSEN